MTDGTNSMVDRCSRSFRLGDPFDGYFNNGTHRKAEPEGLMDSLLAERWMKVVGWGSRADLYTFQQALQGRSGARVRIKGQDLLMISSYDYLGLIGHPDIETAAIEAIETYGTGSGGVRLLTGTTTLHRDLERDLARFKGTEAALTFTSGYLANLGIITSVVGPRDRVVLDERVHRSIVDACRLANVPVHRFRHNEMTSLCEILSKGSPARRTLIIAEGIYSMDGDIVPLPDLVTIKKKYGAFLMIDEAHSFGVLGASGRGVDEYFGVSPDDVDIWTGSLSKAIPSNGGFIASKKDLIIYLQHGAAAFMFSAALSPSATAAARESLNVWRREPERRVRLWQNAEILRDSLRAIGYDTGHSCSPIVPVIAGSDIAAYRLSRALFSHGVLASAVVSPAVTPNGARLRLCATAAHDEETLGAVIGAFRSIRYREPGNGR